MFLLGIEYRALANKQINRLKLKHNIIRIVMLQFLFILFYTRAFSNLCSYRQGKIFNHPSNIRFVCDISTIISKNATLHPKRMIWNSAILNVCMKVTHSHTHPRANTHTHVNVYMNVTHTQILDVCMKVKRTYTQIHMLDVCMKVTYTHPC